MNRYLDPKNDVAFRKLFGAAEHNSLLISLLNAVLRLEGEHSVKSVEIAYDTSAVNEFAWKKSLFRALCTDGNGLQYCVEIHNKRSSHFKKRAQYFAAARYAQGLSPGMNFAALIPTVILCFSDQTLFNDKEAYISCHQILDVTTYDNDLEDISFIFVELSKFHKRTDELITDADKWFYLLKHAQNMGDLPSSFHEPLFIEAFNTLEETRWNENDMAEYKSAALALIDDSDSYQGSLAKGMAEREQRGVEMGKAIGEFETKVGIARILLAKGFSSSEITEMTGLSAQQITDLNKI